MTQPIAWTTLWEGESGFDLSQDEASDRLLLSARDEYAVDLDFDKATALRDALDGWLMRHAYMA